MTQFLISAIGSYGDVHPMVGLGEALASRGHRVKLITNPYFADVVAAAGLELLPIGTREQYLELSQHPDLWHPMRGSKLVISEAAGGFAAADLRAGRGALRGRAKPCFVRTCSIWGAGWRGRSWARRWRRSISRRR